MLYYCERDVDNIIEMSMYGGSCQVFDHYGAVGDNVPSIIERNIKRAAEIEAKKPYEERYSTRFMHNKEKPQDPYKFTGYLRCSIYFTKEQKQILHHFPPLPSKIKPQDFFNRSKYMDELVQKMKLKDSPAEKLVYGLFPLPDYGHLLLNAKISVRK